MELHQLRYFAAVAKLGSFTRAAEACHVSQPTLSQQVAKLEGELGQPLFDRTGRGVTLTAAGDAFRDRVEQALALLDDAKEVVRSDARSDKLTVAAIPTIFPYFMPAVVVAFRLRCPTAKLELREHTTAECLDRLTTGELDAAVLATTPEAPHLVVEPLFTEDLLAVVPEGHPFATAEAVTLSALAEERFLVLHDAHCLAEQSLGFCTRQALAPVVTAKLHQLGTVLELVRLGQGVSLVPAMAVTNLPGVVFVPISGEKPTRSLVVVRSKLRFRSGLSDDFYAALPRSAG